MAAVTICSDFGAQENKVCHCFHCFPIYLLWSDGTGCHDLFFECWVLSQLFHSPLSLSSRGSSVPLHFLPLGWCHLCIWGYLYFSWQSWFQLVLHPALHFAGCSLHISSINRVTFYSLDILLSQYVEPVHCSMSSSKCCFLTCIQVSQESDKVVWCSHLSRIFHSLLWSIQLKALV